MQALLNFFSLSFYFSFFGAALSFFFFAPLCLFLSFVFYVLYILSESAAKEMLQLDVTRGPQSPNFLLSVKKSGLLKLLWHEI